MSGSAEKQEALGTGLGCLLAASERRWPRAALAPRYCRRTAETRGQRGQAPAGRRHRCPGWTWARGSTCGRRAWKGGGRGSAAAPGTQRPGWVPSVSGLGHGGRGSPGGARATTHGNPRTPGPNCWVSPPAGLGGGPGLSFVFVETRQERDTEIEGREGRDLGTSNNQKRDQGGERLGCTVRKARSPVATASPPAELQFGALCQFSTAHGFSWGLGAYFATEPASRAQCGTIATGGDYSR